MKRQWKHILAAAIAPALIAAPSAAADDKLESGIQVGKRLGAYKTTKVGGAEDGVEPGRSICYT